MNDKTLQRANEIKDRLKKLDEEMDLLIDFLPPTKEEYKKRYGRYGRLMRIFHANDETEKQKWINLTGTNNKSCLEMTNDDIRAIYDLRRKEKEELEEEYEKLC